MNTREAAERLTISEQQVRWLIRKGRINAEKFGRDYLIPISEVERAQSRKKKPGPPKSSHNEPS